MLRRDPPRQRDEDTSPALAPPASHHERHCKICSHPERAEIEADFIEWAHPEDTAREFNVSRASIYRHARAVGLLARRRLNLSFALGRLIECVDHVTPTASSIVRAIHAFARINDQGEWIEPPAHVIVSSGGNRCEVPVPRSRGPVEIQIDSPPLGDVPDTAANSPTVANVLPGECALPGTANRVETNATC